MTGSLHVIAVVCMISTPDVCKEIPGREMTGADQVTGAIEVDCLLAAKATADEWIDAHPGWQFLTARCTSEPPAPEGRDA